MRRRRKGEGGREGAVRESARASAEGGRRGRGVTRPAYAAGAPRSTSRRPGASVAAGGGGGGVGV